MAHQLEGHKNHPVILSVTTLHCLMQQTYSSGMLKVEEREFYYMAISFLGRKPGPLKVERPERDGKITENKREN